MKARRVHSIEFKVQIAREYLSHQSTLAQLSRRHELSESLIRIWVGKYKRGELVAGLSPATRERQLESRIAELERKIGQLTNHGKRPPQKNRGAHAPAAKREYLDRERPSALSIQAGCQVMQLARSTYYYRAKSRPIPRLPSA